MSLVHLLLQLLNVKALRECQLNARTPTHGDVFLKGLPIAVHLQAELTHGNAEHGVLRLRVPHLRTFMNLIVLALDVHRQAYTANRTRYF